MTDEALLLSSIFTIFLLSFMNLMLLASAVFVLRWYIGCDMSLDVKMALLFLAVLYIINGCVFLPNKRYAKIMEKYAPKEESVLKQESIIYISTFVVLLFSLVIVGFIYLVAIK